MDLDETTAVLIAALFGALIGGAATTLGSFWERRREVIRQSRIRIYDLLLPTLRKRVADVRLQAELGNYVTNPLEGVGEEWHATRRAAALAGFRDSRKLENEVHGGMDALFPLMQEAVQQPRDKAHGNPIPNRDLAQRQVPHLRRLERQMDEYSDWLERRISWVPWPLSRVPSSQRT